MDELEEIMDHKFRGDFCVQCGRKKTDLLAYGHPDVVIVPGEKTGLSCNGQTTALEITSLREAWRKRYEKFDKMDFSRH